VMPTKRRHRRDQLGRSGTLVAVRLLSLTLFAVIVGSPWPISARSLDPACDIIPSRYFFTTISAMSAEP